MSVTAETQGGHYRSCGRCVFGQCLDIKGNDTTATATAFASAVAEVRFPEDAFVGDYIVSVLTSQLAPTWSIVGINSLELAPDNGTRRFLIRGGPQTTFRLDFSLNSASSNPGGCCADAKQVDSSITVGVQSAALLESMAARYGPRMVNGTVEKGYPSVGLLALRNLVSGSSEAHCTGTLISRSTVLTAAHCVAGVSSGTLRFMLGSDIRDVTSIWAEVDDWRYPQGRQDDAGLQYVPSSYVDDVALVYLKDPVAQGVPIFALHAGNPALRDTFERRDKLTFVGFGQFEAGTGGRGAGVKRKLQLELKALDLRTYTNAGEGSNTCKGDSGAPSFVETSQGGSLVAGVVSKGDDACLFEGINSRVEHYIKWIKDHERK